MRVRIKVRDLRVTDRVFTVWGEGPLALVSVKHANGYAHFKREDGWSDHFAHKGWDDATLDFTADAIMVVWREGEGE